MMNYEELEARVLELEQAIIEMTMLIAEMRDKK